MRPAARPLVPGHGPGGGAGRPRAGLGGGLRRAERGHGAVARRSSTTATSTRSTGWTTRPARCWPCGSGTGCRPPWPCCRASTCARPAPPAARTGVPGSMARVGSMRGAAAIVGVADAVSPTGELELTGRALEATMVAEALADAGLTLDDVDGICHAGSSMQMAEYLGVHPRFTDSTNTGGSSFEVHAEHAAAAIAAGLCDVVVSVYAATPRSDRDPAAPVRATHLPGPEPDAGVGGALRPAHADGSLRPGRRPAHGHLRHHLRAAGPDRGQHPPVGRPQPAGPLPRPDHRRRRAGLAPAVLAAAPARLLPGHRRRRRLRDDQRRAGPRPGQAAGPGAGGRHLPRPLDDQPDAGSDRDPGRGVGTQRLRHGRHRPGRRRRADGLRQLHHHRPVAPRGPGLLRQGRGGRVRGRRAHRARAARCP